MALFKNKEYNFRDLLREENEQIPHDQGITFLQ